MASPNYEVDYNDSRFQQVENDKTVALSDLEKTYAGMINQSDKFYQDQINASKEYAETQKKNQQAQTDFAIKEIEQQKEQTRKDYIKEQSGAYVDYQKQSAKHGVEAEKIAAGGMWGSGYSEDAQTQMYVTYQNRLISAREVFNQAVLNYNNAITEARLQNNSILAEIAYNALQQQLQLSLQGFQYKNTLLQEKMSKKTEVENTYYQKWKGVLDQINTENALAEEVRQYNETMAFNKDQAAKDNAIKQAQLKLQQDQFAWQKSQAAKASVSKSSGGSGSSSSKKSSSSSSSVKKSSSSSSSSKAKKSDSTYSKAAEKLQKAGATTGDGGLMTRTEWLRRKNSGSNRAETSYKTYDDYVNSFTAWRLANPEK